MRDAAVIGRALVSALSLASPDGTRARLTIFIFHRVLDAPDPLFPEELDASRFDERMRWIRALCNVLALDDAVARLSSATLPARAAVITFDDGYADNARVALPILARHGLTATFFIATGFIDGGAMWNDRIIAAVRGCTRERLDLDHLGLAQHDLGGPEARRATIDRLIAAAKYLPADERERVSHLILRAANVAVPGDLMMTTGQIRGLRDAGMQIGAHTASHPILANLALDEARREIESSKKTLEAMLQQPVALFAYPNGKPGVDYRREHAGLARDLGFRAAVSTGWGAADRSADPMQLPRFTPWDRTQTRFGLRLVRNLRRKPEAL